MSQKVTGSGTAELEVFRHYIGGKYHEPQNGRFFDKISPVTGEVDALVAFGGNADVDKGVKAAQAALAGEWGALTGSARGRLLVKAAELIRENQEQLARLDVFDVGKPIVDARADVASAAEYWEFYGGLADKILGTVNPLGRNEFNITLREPLGVVAAILPWNFPAWMFSLKVAPALACGNAVVVKPAEHSPRSALRLAELCAQAGLPAGTVSVVTGDGPGTGAALARHPGVSHVTFCGSTEAGKQVAEMAASHLATVTCQLGGKSPTIVFEDCDLALAVDHAARLICRNQGQLGGAGSRLVIQAGIKTEFVIRLLRQVNAIRVGPPLDERSRMSCVASAAQLERIECFVRVGREEGAKLLTGGKPPSDPTLKGGYYFKPTVFDGVTPEMTIAQEEIFGPVLAILTFDTEAEAVRLANATRYGMTAWVFTGDLHRVHRLMRQLEVASIRVNQGDGEHPLVPFVGRKESGLGHEGGLDVIHTLTRLRNVWINLDPRSPGWSG